MLRQQHHLNSSTRAVLKEIACSTTPFVRLIVPF